MKGVITAPKKVITGAFTVLFSFVRAERMLTFSDIRVETLEGDALGNPKDHLMTNGNDTALLCYLPDQRKGKSRIALSDDFDVAPVIIAYDTIRTLTPVWGTPVRRHRNIEIPITLSEAVFLRKQHFRTSAPMRCWLYGTGRDYQFVVAPSAAQKRFSVSVSGTVNRTNGIVAEIQAATVEVQT